MEPVKMPIPIIHLDDVIPKHKEDLKCAPHLSFDNGSCFPLEVLIKLTIAYNTHCDKTNNDNKIKMYDDLELLHPDEYKRYLLFEIGKRFKGPQHEWIKHKCIKFLNADTKDVVQHEIFRPLGPQGKFDWLSTFDINYALAQYENKYPDFKFLGAVPIDFEELDYLPFKKINFDDFYLEGKTKIGVVFNLDEHYKNGSHWVSLFSDLENGQIYFSDSTSAKPDKRIINFMGKIENYLKQKRKLKNIDVRYNKTQHQRGNTECGVYSINFILRLLKGKTFDHITRKRVSDEKINKCRLVYFK